MAPSSEPREEQKNVPSTIRFPHMVQHRELAGLAIPPQAYKPGTSEKREVVFASNVYRVIDHFGMMYILYTPC